MTATTTMPTAETVLKPTDPTLRMGGFGNLFRKELSQWWGTRLWWIQLLVWVVLLNGITTVFMVAPDVARSERLGEAVKAFLNVGAGAIGIGVILTVQSAIVGEKESGTAAWIMSKPVSRTSFVTAKFAAYTSGFAVTALLVPALVFAVEAPLLLPDSVSYGTAAAGLGLVALVVVFYLALTLCLGTVFTGRGPVAGIGIAFLLTGLFFNGILPEALVRLTPWPVGDIAGSVAMGETLPANWIVPIVTTVLMAIVFIGVGLWRFGREEF